MGQLWRRFWRVAQDSIAYVSFYITLKRSIFPVTVLRLSANWWFSKRSSKSKLVSYVVRNNRRDPKNSSSRLSFYGQSVISYMVATAQYTLNRSAAFAAYPKSTNICLVEGSRSITLAKHFSAPRAVVSEFPLKLC